MATQPLGVRVPIALGKTGYFEQTNTSLEEARSNLLNLILTRKGERLMQPEFGVDVYQYLFEQITTDLKRNIENEIKEAVDMWLPYVELVELEVNFTNDDIENNQMEIKIGFGLKRDLKQYDEIIVVFVL